ncbi:hypothetical protein [Streptomyces sp. NPDC020747]|uniref:hypothetical protein n=1 Tax=Streptomyces sp. NPDC020747 TaxID=3365086 RepID=UPI00379F22B5
MITTLALAALTVAVLYARYRWRLWVLVRAERRRIAAAVAARSQSARRRPWAQRLHGRMPEALLCRLMARTGPPRGRLVRIARRGPGYGRFEKINPAQHILCVGMTGSGKSSTLRTLGAWALARPDWVVEILDGKYGASGAPYLRHARVYEDIAEIEDRLRDLVERELPARARMADRPHRAVIIDESRIFNSLSASALRDLVTLVQEGRELGVHVWAGLQDPKTSSVPSEIRDQFSCRLVHALQTQEATGVALKELATAGYAAHRLDRAGQLFVHEKGRRHPVRPVFGLWLAPAVLASTPGRVCLVKVPPRIGVAPVARVPDLGQRTQRATGNTPVPDALGEAVECALLDGPAGIREIARRSGCNPGSVYRKIAQLTARGVVEPTGDGTYALTTPEEMS